MAYPSFTHIHCSSRFDRSATDLESDEDDWRQRASVITLTEVGNESHGRTLAEKGWGFYNAKGGHDRDECAICWDRSVWGGTHQYVRRLNVQPLQGPRPWIWSCSVALKRKETGHRLLVLVTHAPAHLDTFNWDSYPHKDERTQAYWRYRKNVYQHSMTAWSKLIKDQTNKLRPDGVLVAADWNINLKEDWARHYLRDTFDPLQMAWVRFPTEGGSMSGGPVAPLGAPGKGKGDRIIDGSLYAGLSVDVDPNLMARVRSSDHRPYLEGFRFNNAAGKGYPALSKRTAGGDKSHGDTKKGDEWWGFGDYLDDEIYGLTRITEGSDT